MTVGGSTTYDGEGEAERQLLEGELHGAECTLLGEVQQIERLAQENNSKVEELRGLKDDVAKLEERNEYHVSMLQDEHSSARQELAHKLTVLREQAAQLGLKHDRYKETARLNDAAGAEVESLLLKMERRTKAHGEDVHATRQEVLHLRQELESTFRKTLKDLGGTYRRKAFKALAAPAKEGMRANKLLREEMALQEVGVAALGERHVEEINRAEQFIGELKRLRSSKLGHESHLTDLQREARAHASSFADIQETKTRISEARQFLERKLHIEDVPSRSLSEINDMALQEREEARRLDNLKLRWQRRAKQVIHAIFPSVSEESSTDCSLGSSSQTSSSSTFVSTSVDSTSGEDSNSFRYLTLRGSQSAPPGLEAFFKRGDASDGLTAIAGMSRTQVAKAAWRARVERVTARWAKDRADLACFARVGGQDRDRDPPDSLAKAPRSAKGAAPVLGDLAQLKGKRSASSPALGGILSRPPSPSSRPTPTAHPIGATRPVVVGAMGGSASMGRLQFHNVAEENPWEKKQRMERAIRRRDARIRAKGLAVNSRGREPKASS